MAGSSISNAASDQNTWQMEMKQQATNSGDHVIEGKSIDAKVKSCHQCRHPPKNFAATCKNERKNKPCTLLFCQECLSNRYGEKAEEAEVSEAWSCPKCRNICNCSRCRKVRHQPATGHLSRKAKKAGFSSVSEFLDANVPVKNANDTGSSPEKRGASKKAMEKEISTVNQQTDEEADEKKTHCLTNSLAVSSIPTAVSDQNQSDTNTKHRAANPGVRIIGGKIYDSENGKTCHQCRQKTRSFVAACKNQGSNKPCRKLFCHRCLLNRYGEKAEEVEVLEEWSCPKCRGICNCSCCRKKQGHLPTSITCHQAKATGSVSELLHANGPENIGLVKNVKDTGTSPNKPSASGKITSPRKKGKENLLGGEVNTKLECPTPSKIKEIGKVQGGTLKKVPVDAFGNKKRNADEDVEELHHEKTKKRVKHNIGVPPVKSNRSGSRLQSQDVGNDIPLPNGTKLISIGDVELPLEDVGNALQFLEFCSAFGKTLNMKKGQSVVILKELMNGHTRTLRRSEQHSPVVHFHIQLLSLLQKEYDSRPQKPSPSHGKNSWLFALKNCLSESPNVINSLPIDLLDSESGGYNTLDSSSKLRILVFLCDEVLETERIRDWINKQEFKFAQKAKQAKEKVLAAKDKVKLIDELAKANIAKDGASLSIPEHDEIVRQIKCEAAQAHKEMLESMNMVPKANKRSQALRTQPIFLDVDGRAFWKLNGYSEESNILVQDIGKGDESLVFGEKWLTFDNEQEKVVEKHISFRERMVRAQLVAEVPPSQASI